ncbi:nSTAND1 domain-containing NTPase [Microcoleus sp.]|uniref:nSTAND1 domain-containing NTPase n=1 Tax=Microcoleus sp. TaxID=44472 RepID=UPI00403ECA19
MTEITQSLAIVIGIDKYAHVPTLTSAVNDAKKLAKILGNKKTYKYDVLKLLDSQATYQHFNDLIGNLNQGKLQIEDKWVELDKNHRLLFYFAGHGIADDSPEGEERPEGFLVPQDAELNAENSKLLSMRVLHDALVNTPCRHLLIILDCCFAGSFRWAGLHRNAVSFESTKVYFQRYRRFLEKRAQQVITSAAYNQKALDSIYRFGRRADVGGHSPFAELLFDVLATKAGRDLDRSKDKYLVAIAEDGVVTGTELYAYLRERLYERLGQAAERQTPGFCQLRHHEEGEYIFPLPGFEESSLATAETLSEKLNPYKGLNSFEERDSELFFGRKVLTEELSKAVEAQPLTVVLGASGSGKSSLVKAGLIPCLKLQPKEWQILAPLRPGESPFSALNSVLIQKNLPPVSVPDESVEHERQSLADSVAVWSKNYPTSKLLLVIDQFEELITLCCYDRWREQFLDSIAEALASHPQLRVVLTLRSDFEPLFRDYQALRERWQKARFVVRAMTREELRQAIEEPAVARVMFFEPPGLVERLIDEVANMPGALPLLSFALSELYLISLRSGRSDRTIAEEDYKTLGGVTRSLTQRAEQVYQELITKNQNYEKTIRNVILRMISTSGGELARRRVPLSELEYPEPEKSQIENVKERFVAARLLVLGQYTEEEQNAVDGQPQSSTLNAQEQIVEREYIEPAHDALVRGWTRLREWRRDYEERIALQQNLTSVAVEWNRRGRSPGYLWTRDPRLAVLEEIIDPQKTTSGSNLPNSVNNPPVNKLEDANWLNSLEREFVINSVQERTNQLKKSERQRDEAIEGQINALSSLSEARILTNDQIGALVAGVKAGIRLKKAPLLQNRLIKQVFKSLQEAVYITQERNRIEGSNAPLYRVNFSRDSNLLVTASADKTVKIWKMHGSLCRAFIGHTDELCDASFSSDGKMVASGSKDKTIKVWSADEGTLLQTFAEHLDHVMCVRFSPNGEILASVSADGAVKLWNIAQGKLISAFQSHNGGGMALSFSPDGHTIAVGGWEHPPWQGRIKFWNFSAILLQSLDVDTGVLRAIDFSEDGAMIVCTGDNGKIVLLQVSDGQILTEIKAHNNWTRDVKLSPDGKIIASCSNDETVKLWSIDGSLLKVFHGHTDAVYGVAFSPDGKTLATTGADKTIRLLSLEDSCLNRLNGGRESVHLAVRFSPNGEKLVSASWDTAVGGWTVKIWSASGELLKTLHGHSDSIRTVCFSSDNNFVASASWDGTVKVWTVDGELITNFTKHGTPVEGVSSHYDSDRAATNGISFHPSGKILASGGYDRKVRLWSLDGTPLKVFVGHADQIYRVSFSPDGNLLATASWDKTIKLWSVEGELLQTFTGHSNWLYGLCFSPDGKLLASSGVDRTIQLWDIDEGKLLQTFVGHTGTVFDLSFNPDGTILASASMDKTVRLWSPERGLIKTLARHNAGVYGVSFSPDGKVIAAACWDSFINIWSAEITDFEGLLERGRTWLKDYLNTNPNAMEDRKLINGTDDSFS